jgi:hypothetical protein
MAAVTLSVSTVKPLGDRILVKISEAEEKTAGGILLPDTAKEKPQVGEVVQVGAGKRNATELSLVGSAHPTADQGFQPFAKVDFNLIQ